MNEIISIVLAAIIAVSVTGLFLSYIWRFLKQASPELAEELKERVLSKKKKEEKQKSWFKKDEKKKKYF